MARAESGFPSPEVCPPAFSTSIARGATSNSILGFANVEGDATFVNTPVQIVRSLQCLSGMTGQGIQPFSTMGMQLFKVTMSLRQNQGPQQWRCHVMAIHEGVMAACAAKEQAWLGPGGGKWHAPISLTMI